MIHYTNAQTFSELRQVLDLQEANLPGSVSEAEMQEQGFLTVRHDFKLLKEMNDISPHIIAKDKNKVIGYTLTMSKAFRDHIPVLVPMFKQIERIFYKNQSLSAVDYIVMGQVCIAKSYRGKGIFSGLYREMKRRLAEKYPYIITEIDASNKRSLHAHRKLGFEHLHEYHSPDGKHWILILWNWNLE